MDRQMNAQMEGLTDRKTDGGRTERWRERQNDGRLQRDRQTHMWIDWWMNGYMVGWMTGRHMGRKM